MIPKRVAVASEIERDILSGKYGWEGGLPNAADLAKRFSVSINTIKEAEALLEGKGLIEKRGPGYYVARVPILMTQYVPPAHLRLLSRQRTGFTRNLGSLLTVMLPKHLTPYVGEEAPKEVLYRQILSGESRADGNELPLQLTHRYYLYEVSQEDQEHMHQDPTYDPLWSPRFAIELASHDEICPRLATAEERQLLHLPADDPTAVLHVIEVIRVPDSTPLLLQEIVLSPRFTLLFDYSFVNH